MKSIEHGIFQGPLEPYAMPNLTERGIIATVDLQWLDSGTLNQTSLSEFIRCIQKILSVNLMVLV